MKRICFYCAFALFLLTSSFGAIAQNISPQQAENIVLQLYSDSICSKYDIYQRNELLYQGEDLRTVFGTITVVEADSYIFFIDEEPFGNWEHPCRYVLVNASDASVTTYFSRKPPKFMESYKIIRRAPITIPSGFAFPFLKDFGKASKACNNNESQYAVIISGGMDKEHNFQRYLNDCSFIYHTLIGTYGYKKSNVYVLISDGQDPAADLCVIEGDSVYYASSSFDLDGDGVADIQYAATKANLSKVFDTLASKLTADDNLFIFTIDHGGYDSTTQESYLWLWNNEMMTATEFGAELQKLDQNMVVNTVMGQCHAGGFSTCFDNRINSVATFACQYNEKSRAFGLFDAFVYGFTSALNGSTHYGQPVNADADNNGEISMKEAFEFARDFDTQDHPFQTASNDYLPSVLTMCNKDEFDLVISDSKEDRGLEPNNSSEYMYLSDDIYVRLDNDGQYSFEHQNPISGQTAHVYVKVRNNSYKSYYSEQAEGTVKVYWAKAGLGLSWPQPWQGADSMGGVVLGGLIGSFPVVDPNLEYYKDYCPGLDRIYHFEWQVPNIEDYADMPENWHFCLLAVLESDADPITDNDCTGDLDRFVRNNNNVAWKNITIINNENNVAPAYVSVNNWSNDKRDVNLLFSHPKQEVSPLLGDIADITITLNEPLYKLFEENLSSASGLEKCYDKDFSFIVTKDSASIDLTLQPYELYLLGLDVDFRLGKEYDKEQFLYDISLRDKNNNYAVIGGEQYLIEKWEEDNCIYVDAGANQVINLGEFATLNAANAGTNVSYKWIDKKNDTILTAQTLDVNPIETQQYILKVETENGYVGYDSTSVVVKSNFIMSVSPNPAHNTKAMESDRLRKEKQTEED